MCSKAVRLWAVGHQHTAGGMLSRHLAATRCCRHTPYEAVQGPVTAAAHLLRSTAPLSCTKQHPSTHRPVSHCVVRVWSGLRAANTHCEPADCVGLHPPVHRSWPVPAGSRQHGGPRATGTRPQPSEPQCL